MDMFTQQEREKLIAALKQGGRGHSEKEIAVLLDWANDTLYRSYELSKFLNGSMFPKVEDGKVGDILNLSGYKTWDKEGH